MIQVQNTTQEQNDTEQRRIIPLQPGAFQIPPLTEEGRRLLEFAPDHDGNAQAVKAQYGENIRFSPSYGWYHWNGTVWSNDYHEVRSLVKDVHRNRQWLDNTYGRGDIARRCTNDHANVSGTMKELEGYVKVDTTAFGGEDTLLPAPNGVVDCKSGLILPHDPKYGFTWLTTVAYDPQAEHTREYEEWVKWLREVFNNEEETILALQVYIGYCFTGETKERKMLYGWGDTTSGKGTFTEAVGALMPYPISQEKGVNTFVSKDEDTNYFDMDSLAHARVVFTSETARYQSLNEAKVKAMTGGNTLTASKKGKNPYTFKPKFKILMTSNYEPNADAGDNAIWGRMIVIRFPNSYLGREDTSLKGKFLGPAYQGAILRWAVQGAMRYYQDGKLYIPAKLEKLKQSSRDKLDTVSMWVEECIEISEGTFTSSAAIRKSYENWCHQEGVEPKKARFFADALMKKIPTIVLDLRTTTEKEYTDDSGKWEWKTTTKKRRGMVGIKLL